MKVNHIQCTGTADALRTLEDAVANSSDPKMRGAILLQLEVARAVMPWIGHAKNTMPGEIRDINAYVIECVATSAAAMLGMAVSASITPGSEITVVPFITERVGAMLLQAMSTPIERKV